MLCLQDILENEDVKLDNMFIASLVGDIIRVSSNTCHTLQICSLSSATNKPFSFAANKYLSLSVLFLFSNSGSSSPSQKNPAISFSSAVNPYFLTHILEIHFNIMPILHWAGTMLQAGRSRDCLDWPNPSSHTMVLGSTQPLTEMSTRNLHGV
jgi:hypothetical protein